MPAFQLISNTTRWRAENALGLAMASKLAYEDESVIFATVKEWGFERSDFIESAPGLDWDTQVFVASNAEAIMVSFRGTEPQDVRDWITDADVVMADTPMGGVHYGFWSALDSVWGKLAETIGSHQDQAQSLWFTGHSLGAALATLAVARLREGLKPVNGLYTFGSPRPGSLRFTDRFDQDFGGATFRYVNNADIVTRVPTREMGYSHVGTSLTFDADGNIHSDMHLWNRFLERMKGSLTELLHGKVAPFADHSVANYVTNAEKNILFNPF